ncbi:MAG: OmpA family protein [Pseudomonadota bacterium]|nr:OmpA family protein [Pseudomonadota bacterium]
MSTKLAVGLSGLALCMAIGAQAQGLTDIPANPSHSAYGQDARGAILRSGTGLCWRTGYWSAGDAVTGCDGELAPPFTKATAPDLVPASANAEPTAPIVIASPPRRCDFTLTFASDDSFGFGKATLSAATRRRLLDQFAQRAASCARIERILVTGHTDRLGNPARNLALSQQRAAALANVLHAADVVAPIEVRAAGSAQPQVNCPQHLSRTKLVSCLAPNRRAVIETFGIAK